MLKNTAILLRFECFHLLQLFCEPLQAFVWWRPWLSPFHASRSEGSYRVLLTCRKSCWEWEHRYTVAILFLTNARPLWFVGRRLNVTQREREKREREGETGRGWNPVGDWWQFIFLYLRKIVAHNVCTKIRSHRLQSPWLQVSQGQLFVLRVPITKLGAKYVTSYESTVWVKAGLLTNLTRE